MRIVVTGATSFIGRTIVDYILKKEWECIAIVRNEAYAKKLWGNDSNIRIISLDIRDFYLLGAVIGKVDCLIMLAWDGTRGASRMNYKLQRSNYEYSFDLAKSLILSGCNTIITSGSQAEYGYHETSISELSECKPNTEYGIYKLKLYLALNHLCKTEGVRLIEPRFFSLYGPGDNVDTMIMKTIDRMLKNIPCDLTKCIQMWDFLYIQDAVEAVMQLLENTDVSGVFNFGSGDCRPLKSFVEEMRYVLGSKSELRYGVVPYPDTGMVSIRPNVEKLKQTINWSPKISFPKGIEKTANVMREKL